jgi:anion-transporting  ArsA/GET3 family ATPase
MTLETFKEAKELREQIENLEDLENLFENAFESKNNVLIAQKGCSIMNTITAEQIPEKLRDKIIDTIIDFRCDLEDKFEYL